jgi:hypothetical protein
MPNVEVDGSNLSYVWESKKSIALVNYLKYNFI